MTIQETICEKNSDHTYVSGELEVTRDINTDEIVHPLRYNGKAEEHDPDGSYTLVFPDDNIYIVYDGNDDNDDNIIRIVKTCTCWSDDYIKWEFDKSIPTAFMQTFRGQTGRVWEKFTYINGEDDLIISEVVWGKERKINDNIEFYTPADVLYKQGLCDSE